MDVKRNAFSACHPAIAFAFFAGAIVLCVLVQRPAYQAVGFIAAAVLYLAIRGSGGWRAIGGALAAFAALALLNPLFNTQGATVLFLVGDRPYTVEALAFGASTAAMFVTMLLWFFSFSHVLSSDKLMYLFGGVVPSLALVSSMVLRLVPSYRRRAGQVVDARQCIGKGGAEGSLRQRVAEGAAVLSTLVTWSLEAGVATADAMSARGYGLGKRTSFAGYHLTFRDSALAVVLAVGFVAACAGLVASGATVGYLPAINMPPLDFPGLVGLVAFAVFLLAPGFLCMGEGVLWRFSASKA